MKFSYKYQITVVILSMVAALLSIVGVIYQSVITNHYQAGTFVTFLIISCMVLLIISNFAHFENRKLPTMFNFIAYCIYLFIYGNYFVKTSYSVSQNSGDNVVLQSVNSIFGVFCGVSFVLLVASLIVYSCATKPKDSLHLLQISGLLLLMFSVLFCGGNIVGASLALIGNGSISVVSSLVFESTMYLVVSIIVFFITYFIKKEPFNERESLKNGNTVNSQYVLTEKEKAETLQRFGDLLKEGAISKEEFDRKKKELLK